MTVDDYTPTTTWPPMFGSTVDESRVHWLEHPILRSTEVRVAADLAQPWVFTPLASFNDSAVPVADTWIKHSSDESDYEDKSRDTYIYVRDRYTSFLAFSLDPGTIQAKLEARGARAGSAVLL